VWPLLLILSACGDWNRPVKEDLEYYFTLVPVSTWEELSQKAEELGSGYTFFILNDMEASSTVAIDGKRVVVTGRGRRTITRASVFTGAFFELTNNGSLSIGDERGSLVLDGNAGAVPTAPLVTVNEGDLVLNNSELRNNKCGTDGGGVYFEGGGNFTMNKSVISDNFAENYPLTFGGGVYFNSTGSFTMNTSVISDNTCGPTIGASGGGVFFTSTGDGSFIMHNSVINGNICNGSTANGGGGVHFMCGGNGVFVMTDSRIEDNRVGEYAPPPYANGGGGVSLLNNGSGECSFTMTNSIIRNNTGFQAGGGVYLRGGTLNNYGEIRDNTALVNGGGVYIAFGGGTLNNYGEISGNTAPPGTPNDVHKDGGTINDLGVIGVTTPP
jgi:hypothetical protein